MNMKLIKSSEKRKIISDLYKNFGVESLPWVLFETGKQKVRAFSGSMSREEIKELLGLANVEIVGLYLLKKEANYYRISLDGTHMLKREIKKNLFELNENQADNWLRAGDLEIKGSNGPKAVKFNCDLMGCGYAKKNKLINFIPKERTVRIRHYYGI